MKTKIIAVLFFILPSVAFSQANQTIDFVGGFEYSFRNLTTSSTGNRNVLTMQERNLSESGKYNWRMGFNYNVRLTKRLFYRTGLRLASVGYKGQKLTGLRWPSEHDGMGGYLFDPSLPHEIQDVEDYWFIEVPLAGRFHFGDKKWTPFVELCLSPSIYVATREKRITDIGSEAAFQKPNGRQFNRVHLVGFISFGLNYSINDRFQIFGQPIFRYHFTPLEQNPIAENLYNYGIELGLRTTIK